MRRKLSIVLALCLLLTAFAGCGKGESAPETTAAAVAETLPAETTPETREFTDSVGRTVTVPYEITTIAVSGPLSQVYILPLAGDMLAGVSNSFADSASVYLPDYVTQRAVQNGSVILLDAENFAPSLWKQLLYHRDKWVSPQMQAVIAHFR